MLKKEVILITGCSSGFGFRTALKFAREGYKTYASVRNVKNEGTLKLKDLTKKENLPLTVLEIDVTNDKSVKKGVEYVFKNTKRVDILVNNAGWGYKGAVEEYSIGEIVEQYQTNVFGMLRMVKGVAPIMRKNKKGMIINISSINGLIPFPMMGIYSSSKYAVESLTEVLRFELSHFGIKVTQIEPGTFLTEGTTRNLRTSKQSKSPNSVYLPIQKRFVDNLRGARDKVARNRIISRFLDPERVVNLIFEISQTENPKMRYRIGVDAQIYYWAKRFLPESVWEWLMHKAFKW